jgi:hypoxanthine phosphoribosyltransferase
MGWGERMTEQTTGFEASNFSPSLALSARSFAQKTGRRKRRMIALRLILVTLAALFGGLTFAGELSGHSLDYAGIIAVLAFIGVLGVRTSMYSDHDLDDGEPRANALADLVTSHAWRFAIGARPYTTGTPELDGIADVQFVNNLDRYQRILEGKYSVAVGESAQITQQMKGIRAGNLESRRELYIAERVKPLATRNSDISMRLKSRLRLLTVLVLFVELIGIPAGMLKVIGFSRIDLLGVTAAAAASIALWVDTLNFGERSRAARAISAGLSSATDRLGRAHAEEEWAAMVSLIEDRLILEAEAQLGSDAASLRPRDAQDDDIHAMSAEEYFAAARTLKRQIWDEGGNLTKLEPDVIVAVNPGGAILGGILYFMTRAGDFLPISLRCGLEDEDIENMLKAAPWKARKEYLSILLVDASMKSGGSLRRALGCVERALATRGYVPESGDKYETGGGARKYVLRTAVIVHSENTHGQEQVRVDYYVSTATKRFPYGSV